jgi:sulfate transport system permease protein
VLREIGSEPEEAARTLGASRRQTFWLITLPQIRWGLAYGVVLATARGLGEFGAVSIVSGRIAGQTETLPLYVQELFNNFEVRGAYAIAVELAVLALITLIATRLLARRRSYA